MAIHAGEGKVSAANSDLMLDGSVDTRSRMFDTLSFDKNDGSKDQVDTQTRVRLGVSMTLGDVKGRIQFENDWDTWGRFETPQGQSTVATAVTNTATGAVSTTKAGKIAVREAWVNFNLPGTPVGIKAGHQFLQLAHGWFFRSMKYGSDAWVVYTDIDALHLGLVNVKVSEGATAKTDDIDAYALLGVLKLNDSMKAGLDLTMLNDRVDTLGFGGTQTELQNLGLNFTGMAGPVNLKAELDIQMGKVTGAGGADPKFKGNQVVVQGALPVNPLAVSFTVARGSGPKTSSTDFDQFVNFLDADPHYTLLYEYKIAGACGSINQGFCNTTALNVGATYAVTKKLKIGADLWMLQATEKVADATGGSGTTSELGNELDVKVNWMIADNLSWNWTLGYLDPGKGLGKDPATGVQGVLSAKF
jgi:hypothetical protein